jgi:hypothetical protein
MKIVNVIEFVKKNFLQSLILFIACFLLFRECTRPNNTPFPQPTIVVKIDSSWINKKADNITINPVIQQTIPYKLTGKDTQYIPSPNYDILKKQYEDLRDSLLSINIYKDSLKIDSLGYVILNESVFKNKLLERKYSYNLKYPRIKETITITQPYLPKTQIYIGGELYGNQLSLIKGVGINLSLKSKKDKIYEIGTMYLGNELIYKGGYKIKL